MTVTGPTLEGAMTTTATHDRWLLARHRFRDDGAALLLIWVGFAIFMLVLTAVVAAFRTIEVSGWESGSQLPRWYIGAVGVYLAAVYLPLYVAHGFTRRDIARQLVVSGAVTVAALAALMTLGYGIERVVYDLAGWPQALRHAHLFASPTDLPLILLEFLLLFAVWAAAGAFVGATIYREPGLGLLSVPLGVALVGLAELTLSPGALEVMGGIFGVVGLDLSGLPVAGAVAVCLGCVAVTLPLTWLTIRDVPLRTQRG